MRKAKKKILIVFICIVAIVAIIAVVAVCLGIFYSYSNKINERKFIIPTPAFSATVKTCDEIVEVNAWHNDKDNKEYLFLPYDADINSMSFHSGNSASFKVNGEKIKADEPTGIISDTGTYRLEDDSNEYELVVLKGSQIPSIHIETESGSLERLNADKSNKEAADIRIFNKGELINSDTLKYIKGRGNKSWEKPQKSYNIKYSKKTDLFDMGEAKKYCLIANYTDLTLIKNHMTYSYADDIGLSFVSESQPVDLYINNNYMGSYLLAESIDVNKSRVDINNLEKANEKANQKVKLDELEVITDAKDLNSTENGTMRWVDIKNEPEDIKSGYILELELSYRYIYEKCGFITTNGQPIVLKSPELASKGEVEYVYSIYQAFEDALVSPDGYNGEGKYYTDYIDLEAFAKMYLVEEFSRNGDAHCTSTFMYLDDTGILKAGPVWDFDFAYGDSVILGNMNENDKYPPDKMLVCENGFFRELFRHEDFRQEVARIWREQARDKAQGLLDFIDNRSELLAQTAVMNGIRWNRYITTDVTENEEKYSGVIDDLKEFVSKRIDFFDSYFADDTAVVFYSANDVYVRYQECEHLKKGDSASIIQNPYDCSRVFLGWNTSPDGSGTQYNPGDEIKLTEPTLFLYAQWSEGKSTKLRIKYKIKDIFTQTYKDFDYRLNDIKGA